VNRAGLSGHPIGLLQFDAPEMRSRGDKFDAHALAVLGVVAEIDHPAFLLFLRGGIGEYEQRSHFQVLVGVEQSAMRIDNNRFAGMPEPFRFTEACAHITVTIEGPSRRVALPSEQQTPRTEQQTPRKSLRSVVDFAAESHFRLLGSLYRIGIISVYSLSCKSNI
jgi:hypothetical protein